MKRFNIVVNGTAYDVQVEEVAAGAAPVAAAPVVAAVAAPVAAAEPAPAPVAASAATAGATKINAPMPGNINDIKVEAGQAVKTGDVLLVLEAMKMENDIVAPVDGVVAGVHVAKGDMVDTGALMVSLN